MTDDEIRAAAAALLMESGSDSDKLFLWLTQQARSDIEKAKQVPSPMTADTAQEGVSRVSEAARYFGRAEAFHAVATKLREGFGS
jgi:hypothetical protein